MKKIKVLDRSMIRSLLIAQNGRCALTGEKLKAVSYPVIIISAVPAYNVLGLKPFIQNFVQVILKIPFCIP